MVKIGFVRCGDINHMNRKMKGVFYREFENIGEASKWFVGCYPKVCIADRSQLTKSQWKSFILKMDSLRRKKRDVDVTCR